ncbi:hypothetical protein K466DRAFT_499446 [Polyporus arcularius HHB13444]|uniref:N-acetyltransferase domain-containing protein n=1 Tax=Polyporus arcularius HHB13444 TaxID=1314778 RepID=A0A5C3PAP3_9APHY|nr:hypothetical protein K466DRAFT_499446 [Polyporus arcularius HHB13444]
MSLGVIKPLALVSGEMYTAKNEHGKLIGFTLWGPPGRDVFDTPDQLEMGYQEYLQQLDDEARKFQAEMMGKTIPRFIDSTLEMDKAVLNTYWCWFAMVRKEDQGKGLCQEMFNLTYEKAKAIGATMGLITGSTHNVMIYEKMGLRLRGKEKMSSPWADWTFYSMSRDTMGE